MNILLVEDDVASRKSLRRFFEKLQHTVVECADGEMALAAISLQQFDLILSDIRMPKLAGIELLRHVKRMANSKNTPVVMFTGYGTMDSAIEAMRLGAMDYLLKPVDVQQLIGILDRVADKVPPRSEGERSVGLTEHPSIGVFSEELRRLHAEAQMYSRDRTIPVLIRGETGTGKEMVAHIIHGSDGTLPFIDINCAAITNSLFESELFGYESGSFTGSLARGQKGKIDLAAGGTLFLDEVAEIPLELQGKLLRFLQEKEFYRVGGLKKIKSDVRIVCATNVNLEEAVENRTFRRDLYYRLKVGQLFLAPLRQRVKEIIPLAEKFLSEFSVHKQKAFHGISPEAKRLLEEYQWPGNIRELRNVIERAVFMYDDSELKVCHLEEIGGKGNTLLLDNEISAVAGTEGFLQDHIIEVVEQTIRDNQGNKAAAARILGISRSSIYRILDRRSS